MDVPRVPTLKQFGLYFVTGFVVLCLSASVVIVFLGLKETWRWISYGALIVVLIIAWLFFFAFAGLGTLELGRRLLRRLRDCYRKVKFRVAGWYRDIKFQLHRLKP
jgi:cytochrome c biogenesis protein CcdA